MEYLKKWPLDFDLFCLENHMTNKVRIYDKQRYHISEVPYWFDAGLEECFEKIRQGKKKISKRK